MKDRNLALIVDDSELNRSMLADILSDEYDIIEAENGLEAISQFESTSSISPSCCSTS